MKKRKVTRIVRGRKTVDGAGVHLRRILGEQTVVDFDPFLMLDGFDSTNPQDYIKGFPWHPHRGIETITYLVSGTMEHEDSLGNKGVIQSMGCQWMTAGSGILHKEMPQPSERMLGCQLWVNLPAAKKMVPPAYRDIIFCSRSWRRYGRTGRGESRTGRRTFPFVVGSSPERTYCLGRSHSDE